MYTNPGSRIRLAGASLLGLGKRDAAHRQHCSAKENGISQRSHARHSGGPPRLIRRVVVFSPTSSFLESIASQRAGCLRQRLALMEQEWAKKIQSNGFRPGLTSIITSRAELFSDQAKVITCEASYPTRYFLSIMASRTLHRLVRTTPCVSLHSSTAIASISIKKSDDASAHTPIQVLAGRVSSGKNSRRAPPIASACSGL